MYQELPPSTQAQVYNNPMQPEQVNGQEVKPKHKLLKILGVGVLVLIGLIIMAIVGFIALGFFSLKPSKTASTRIESPGTMYSEGNKLYIADRGKVLDTGIGTVQKTPPVIWVYDLSSGNLLNQAVSGTMEYQEAKKEIDKYNEVNKWKLIPLSNGVAYGATSSATKKTYIGSSRIIEGKGAEYYVDVYGPENKKIGELPYNPELMVEDSRGYIYIAAKERTGSYLYKLDPKTDAVISKKKFPVDDLGIQIDYTPFISDEAIYLLPIVIPTDVLRVQVVIYDFNKDEFDPKFNIDGQYSTVFPKDDTLFLSGRSGVVQVDRSSGRIIKKFTEKSQSNK